MKRDLSKPLAPSEGGTPYSDKMAKKAIRQTGRAKSIKARAKTRKETEAIKGKDNWRSDKISKRADKVMGKAVKSYKLHKQASKDTGFSAPNALK